jgi:hypothetical protein
MNHDPFDTIQYHDHMGSQHGCRVPTFESQETNIFKEGLKPWFCPSLRDFTNNSHANALYLDTHQVIQDHNAKKTPLLLCIPCDNMVVDDDDDDD